MRERSLRSSCLLALAIFFAASVASAQPPPKPKPGASTTDTAQAEARQRFNEGIALADAGDHEAARLKFDQAWVLLKSPAVLYNLARAEQLSGHLLEALDHYRLFGTMASDPKVTDAQRQRAKENVAELSKKVGQIVIDAPAGARLSIDGRTIDPASNDPIPVAIGKHTIEAIVDGKVRSVTVDAQPGTITRAKPVDETAAPPVTAPKPDADKPPAKPPADEPSTLFTTRNIVGGSLGIASVVVGAVAVGLLIDSNGQASDAKEFNTSVPGGACARVSLASCAEYTDKLDSASSSRTLSYVAFAGVGLFAAGAIATFALWPSSKKESATSLRPVFTGTTLGLRADW